MTKNFVMKEALIKLHVAVLIAGTTGLFGKLVSLSAFPLVFYRVGFAAVLFWLFMWSQHKLRRLPLRNIMKMGMVGLLLVLHWTFFYASIKYSNISIGVVCFSTVGFFTAVFDPLISRRRFSVKELLFSLLTIAGIYLIFQFDTRYRVGIGLGLVSSALNALFTIFNKRVGQSTGYPSGTLLLYSMTGGALGMIFMLPFFALAAPAERLLPNTTDLMWLLALSSVSTILLYLLQIQVLKVVSAFTVSLTFNLEPIYSIILAMLFFGEAKELNLPFYCGLMCIFASVMLQTLSIVRQGRKQRAA